MIFFPFLFRSRRVSGYRLQEKGIVWRGFTVTAEQNVNAKFWRMTAVTNESSCRARCRLGGPRGSLGIVKDQSCVEPLAGSHFKGLFTAGLQV
uniref:Uncharacterized protein n=1 Tax=Physcomitrium patens TaxID=3218 RepID=A0A2K1JU05_PHYPA|nr:hypothetical protein PHYPA_014770 [Physcomitrium patens]